MPYLKKQAPCPEPIDCKILTAGLNLFVKKGYHNVSIHEIQKESDVSIGSIYRHFNNKEGVAKALYHHVLNELDKLIDSVLENSNQPNEQLAEIIKQLFEHTETHPEIIAYLFHTKHIEFLPEEPLILITKPFKKVQDIIKFSTHKTEPTNTSLEIDSAIVLGSITHLIQMRLDGLIKKPLMTEDINELKSKLWQGLCIKNKYKSVKKGGGGTDN